MKRKAVLIALIVLAAAFVVVLALRNREAPPMPNDPNHYTFFDAESCLKCHGPGKLAPQGENHPIGNDCLRCHSLPKP